MFASYTRPKTPLIQKQRKRQIQMPLHVSSKELTNPTYLRNRAFFFEQKPDLEKQFGDKILLIENESVIQVLDEVKEDHLRNI